MPAERGGDRGPDLGRLDVGYQPQPGPVGVGGARLPRVHPPTIDPAPATRHPPSELTRKRGGSAPRDRRTLSACSVAITAYAAWGALVLALLGGCGVDGRRRVAAVPLADDLAHPHAAGADPDSASRADRAGEETTSPEPEPTEPEPTETEPEPEPTETEPEPEPTETQPEPTPSEAGSPSDGATDDTDADAAAEEDGTPSWLWWLLAGLAALAVLVIALVVRSRRRGSWHDQYDEAVAEVTWFARELLPQLRQAGSAERLAGGWQVGSARVGAVEDQLTGLEATAPSDTDRERTRTLRDTVRVARSRVQALAAPGPHPEWALDIDDVIASLEAALGPADAARLATAGVGGQLAVPHDHDQVAVQVGAQHLGARAGQRGPASPAPGGRSRCPPPR